jgi:hypothetical protein
MAMATKLFEKQNRSNRRKNSLDNFEEEGFRELCEDPAEVVGLLGVLVSHGQVVRVDELHDGGEDGDLELVRTAVACCSQSNTIIKREFSSCVHSGNVDVLLKYFFGGGPIALF